MRSCSRVCHFPKLKKNSTSNFSHCAFHICSFSNDRCENFMKSQFSQKEETKVLNNCQAQWTLDNDKVLMQANMNMCITQYILILLHPHRNSFSCVWDGIRAHTKKEFYFSNKCHSFYRNFKFMAFRSMAFYVEEECFLEKNVSIILCSVKGECDAFEVCSIYLFKKKQTN